MAFLFFKTAIPGLDGNPCEIHNLYNLAALTHWCQAIPPGCKERPLSEVHLCRSKMPVVISIIQLIVYL